MILFLHVVIASASVTLSAYAAMRPSVKKLQIAYALVALTFISGFYLVFTKPAHMVEACVMGLAYLAIVSLGIVSARYKLARITT